jgi:16S rRNA processing protein RimM
MEKKDFYKIGQITKFNRKTAELSIRTHADDADVYAETSLIFIEVDGGLVPFYLTSLKVRDTKTIQVLLEDYDTPDKAAQFIDCQVFVPTELTPKLENDEFYFHEIVGFEVIDEKHGSIGTLEDILDRPEQEILQISHLGKEILIPLVDEIFVKIDHEKKQLFIDAPEGLIELYLEEKA